MININKDYVDTSTTGISSNINNWSYNYCVPQVTLLDKYYRAPHTKDKVQMPKNAQRDIIDILNNKHEYNIQVTVDYLTIEVEDSALQTQYQALCHVVIKSLGYNYYSMPVISYNTILPKPIEITCNTAQAGIATCDCETGSKFVVNSNTDFIKQ